MFPPAMFCMGYILGFPTRDCSLPPEPAGTGTLALRYSTEHGLRHGLGAAGFVVEEVVSEDVSDGDGRLCVVMVRGRKPA